MLDTLTELVQQHTWEVVTITLSPLVGFIVAKYVKHFIKEKTEKSLRTKILMGTNAFVTGMAAFWTWPGGINESLKVAMLLAMLGPFIVWLWFNLAARWAPKTVTTIAGVEKNENWQDMTYFNMFKTPEKKD
jgi:hypothetical protein